MKGADPRCSEPTLHSFSHSFSRLSSLSSPALLQVFFRVFSSSSPTAAHWKFLIPWNLLLLLLLESNQVRFHSETFQCLFANVGMRQFNSKQMFTFQRQIAPALKLQTYQTFFLSESHSCFMKHPECLHRDPDALTQESFLTFAKFTTYGYPIFDLWRAACWWLPNTTGQPFKRKR